MNSSKKTLESMSQAEWYNRWTLAKFASYLRGDILEIGCGIGSFTKSLLKYGNVWAIDIDNENLNQTKDVVNNAAEVGFGDIEQGKYFFTKKSFDCLICINVLEHIRKDARALKNIYKLLKKNGVLIMLVPVHSFLFGTIDESIGHFRRYEKNKLINLLKTSGFVIDYVRILNFLGAMGWFVSSKIFKDKKIDKKRINLFNLIAPPLLFLEDLIKPPIGTSILVIAKKKKQ